MKEVMYDKPSLLIAAILFVSMGLFIEIGFQIGKRFIGKLNETAKNHIAGIQASIVGILALLLGFTFSLALQRYDTRSQAVVDESNAIGTAWLRTRLLAPESREQVKPLLRDYIDLRVRASKVDLAHGAERSEVLAATNQKMAELWSFTSDAARAEPNPVTTGLFVQSLNEMFDSYGSRDAAVRRHVPEVVLFLLYGTFLMAGSVIGTVAGSSGHRASFATYIMIALVVLLVFIIIDLDRPRRGLIEVDQQPLIDVRAAVHAEMAAAAPQK
jgi:hypothetical protein